MNYFLVLVVLGMAGFSYYQHNQDEMKVADLQQQIVDLKKGEASPGSAGNSGGAITTIGPDQPETAPNNFPAPSTQPMTISPEVKVVAPITPHSSAIDQAAHAATVAASTNTNNLGNINTLDGRTFQNCKVLKVEADGVTFSHDDGITKVLFPLLPPNVQKQFDYDPAKAVAQTEAEVRYDQQRSTAASTTNSPGTPVSQ